MQTANTKDNLFFTFHCIKKKPTSLSHSIFHSFFTWRNLECFTIHCIKKSPPASVILSFIRSLHGKSLNATQTISGVKREAELSAFPCLFLLFWFLSLPLFSLPASVNFSYMLEKIFYFSHLNPGTLDISRRIFLFCVCRLPLSLPYVSVPLFHRADFGPNKNLSLLVSLSSLLGYTSI